MSNKLIQVVSHKSVVCTLYECVMCIVYNVTLLFGFWQFLSNAEFDNFQISFFVSFEIYLSLSLNEGLDKINYETQRKKKEKTFHVEIEWNT